MAALGVKYKGSALSGTRRRRPQRVPHRIYTARLRGRIRTGAAPRLQRCVGPLGRILPCDSAPAGVYSSCTRACGVGFPARPGQGTDQEAPVQTPKADALKRLAYIEGHLKG